MHLNHQHRKFVHRLLTGATAKAAYLHAFPDAQPSTARSAGPRLAKNPKIQAELTALRERAEPNPDFLSYVEMRKFHARVVRAQALLLPDDSDLWNVKKSSKGISYLRFPDKLRTLALDAKLAGYYTPQPPPEPEEKVDELAAFLESLRDSPPYVPQSSVIAPPQPQPPPPQPSPSKPSGESIESIESIAPDPTPKPPPNVRPILSPREWVRLYRSPRKKPYGSSFFALLASFFLALLAPASAQPRAITFGQPASDFRKTPSVIPPASPNHKRPHLKASSSPIFPPLYTPLLDAAPSSAFPYGPMRKTKIIATLGPATDSPEMIRALIDAGVNCFRLNMSHATHDGVRAVVPRIRQAATEAGKVIGILMDTQGPAIRTGDLSAKLALKPGDIFEFTVRGEKSEEVSSVDVNYDGLVDDVNVGDIVLVDNGVIHMRVLSKTGNKLRCEVLTEGVMGSRRHINLPGVKVNLPPLTEKDLADVALGAHLGVDYVALSFCREPGDVELLRKVLGEHSSRARIVAKIEDQLAVKNIEEIIKVTDWIMVARGDLGIECPMEDLPIIQRRIVKKCIELGRPVIVATHMLESMIVNPVPTRAEVTDVANAVYEEADAIMLSGETTTGKYPVKCVQAFDRIARRIERSDRLNLAERSRLDGDRERTVRSAVVLANSVADAKLVVFTRRGTMASYVASQRPAHAPIYAFSPSWELCRKLTLLRAVQPVFMDFAATPERTIAAAELLMIKYGLAKPGDRLIIVTDIFAGEDRFDSIQLREVR